MTKNGAKEQIIELLTLRAIGKPLPKPSYEALEALARSYEGLLVFLADTDTRIRNRILSTWKTTKTGKPGRPRTRDDDQKLVEKINHLKQQGSMTDADAIRRLIDLSENGEKSLSKTKKKQMAKTIANRVGEARKRATLSRK